MPEDIKCFQINDNWFIDKDTQNKGLENNWTSEIPQTAVPTPVPSIIQETLPEYHGVAFYWCKLKPQITCGDNERAILRFKGVDYKAQVWLNGDFLGEHEGGEAPFDFDVTDKLNFDSENLISVRVVNPINYDIDGLNISNAANRNKTIKKSAGACLNSGGIWYGVELFSVPEIYIDDKFLTGDIHSGKLSAKVYIKNALLKRAPASLSLKVYGKTEYTHLITSSSIEIFTEKEFSETEISLTVPNVKLWDTDDPFLYRVEIILTSAYGEHCESLNFGFREFKIIDGFFHLNGRKIFLKSAHSGNAFPIGQNYPVVKEHIRKDMIMAKTYGFNTVRSIAGLFRPEQLDICDEIGLLVYEECMASWQLGEARFLLENESECDMDQEKMFRRFDICTLDMVKRDRNHPSVVIWGLLNEMHIHNPIALHAENFISELRKEDSSRLVLLHSGRWDSRRETASASNPYSEVWDGYMGADGKDFSENPIMDNGLSVPDIGDYHYYPQFPMREKDINLIRNYAKNDLPAFISESGIGPLFNVIEETKHFQQYGCRKDLEDYSWLAEQSNGLEADWKKFGLEKVYPFAEMMLKESQRLSAMDRRFLFDAIRSNPKHNGYSLTGLLDHGMCGEGLWSLWRRFKPEVYDTVCDGWAPLRFCLFAKHHAYSNEEFEIEAVLANENILKQGKYIADFAIMGANGTINTFSEEFEITNDSFAIPVMKKKIALDVPTGKYSLVAYLRSGGSPLGNKLDFHVKNIQDLPRTTEKIYIYGLEQNTVDFLKKQGATVELFNDKTNGTVLIGKNTDESILKKAKDAAASGAKVVFMSPHSFYNSNISISDFLGIADDLRIFDARDWLYHKECIASNEYIFEGLGLGICDSTQYGQTFPFYSYMTSRTPEDIICPAFYVGSPHVNGAYASGHTIAGFTSGKGMIYLNCFLLEENIGKNPAADMILINLINYLSKTKL